MRRVANLACGVLAVALSIEFGAQTVQAQQRYPILEGPLTADCPFGYCPATRRARTWKEFVDIFGYLPESSGVKVPGIPNHPPKNWPPQYWYPNAAQIAMMKTDPEAPFRKPGTAVTHTRSTPVPPANAAPPRNTVPPKNTVPPASSVAAKKPSPVPPPKNVAPPRAPKSLSPADVAAMQQQLTAQQTKLLDDIGRRVANAPDPEHRAALQQTIERIGGRLNNGGPTGQDVADLARGIQNALPPGDQRAALDATGQIAAMQQVGEWINGNGGAAATGVANAANGTTPGAASNRPTNPGTGGRLGASNAAGGAGPQGNLGGGNAPIALIPGLPLGWLIPLTFDDGGGAFLVGRGRPGGQILLGTGNPDQAAGLLVAPPDAEPAGAAANAPAAGETLLSNAAGGPVGYSVNQSNFTMQPRELQTLPGGAAWTVEFDRANSRGTARYQLEPGYYEFRVADGGWELYRKQFTVTLDNIGGSAPFTYVVDDRTETVAVGESRQLSGIYPPVVRFDDGADRVKQRRLTDDHYRVALDGERTFDLFPADAVPVLAAAPSSAPAAPPAPQAPSLLGAPAAVSSGGDSAGTDPKSTDGLPPGFQLFDATAAVTERGKGFQIPRGFSFFQEIAAAE